jgi:hypothetical protein
MQGSVRHFLRTSVAMGEPVAGFCEHGNELQGFTKGGGLLYQSRKKSVSRVELRPI